MKSLEGRVAIITGAGRGIGREHALLFAREGARVVVNDVGAVIDGSGHDPTPAEEVVEEIRGFGGEAVASDHDVTKTEEANQLVATALESFGALHVLVNNAGILRDRMLINMTDEEWDDVIRVHLRGHFLPTRAAVAYWRERHKAGSGVSASIINTSSTSGLFANPGQTNYAAAKAGIAALTITGQAELARYGVRCNAIAPGARTRLTLSVPGSEAIAEPPVGEFDVLDPANISPFVAYLATEDCPIRGRVFFVRGGEVVLFQPWALVERIATEGRWTVEELAKEAARFATVEFDLGESLVMPEQASE